MGSVSWSRERFLRHGSRWEKASRLSSQMALSQKSITKVPVIAEMSEISWMVISTVTVVGDGSGRAFLSVAPFLPVVNYLLKSLKRVWARSWEVDAAWYLSQRPSPCPGISVFYPPSPGHV